MKEPNFTLGNRWINNYTVGAALLHTLLGHPLPSTPVSPPDPETLINLLQDIVSNNYVSGKYFNRNSENIQSVQLISEAPPIELDQTYLMITVNVHSSLGMRLSGVYSGGIIYEEPIWAMLAAVSLMRFMSVSSANNTTNPLVIPKASDYKTLWQNLSRASTAIKNGRYSAEQFFSEAEPLQPENQPTFNLVSVKGNYVQALRENGRRTLPAFGGPRFFEFYATV